MITDLNRAGAKYFKLTLTRLYHNQLTQSGEHNGRSLRNITGKTDDKKVKEVVCKYLTESFGICLAKDK